MTNCLFDCGSVDDVFVFSLTSAIVAVILKYNKILLTFIINFSIIAKNMFHNKWIRHNNKGFWTKYEFNYDFGSVTTESPVIKAVYSTLKEVRTQSAF